MADDDAPHEEDLRSEDHEFNPAVEPDKATAWLNLLLESEDAFEDWNERCDRIEEQYASLSRLSASERSKEFQMFWSNCEVLKPSIYAKPPVPVVVPKFKDRRPVYQAASEVMERTCVVAFDIARINDLMLLVRDDLALTSRGVAWCRYESGKGKGKGHYSHEKVCIDFKHRRDFLHSIARNWREVTWVAAASYLTRSEARKRFEEYSGDAYQEAEYKVDKESKEIGGADNRERAKFWEIWDRNSGRVLWVAHGVEDILDEEDAHLDLPNFFPCPKPVFGTTQRGSLIPVPDILQYRDQLVEIHTLTGRIHALSQWLKVKGFYPAGGGEIGDAIQTALSINSDEVALVPISNWAGFGGTKEVILWSPIDMIATTIQGLVQLRKQVIEDVYQIMGLSDIMRGATDPNETLGAQQLKTQNGSTRIKDKQQELVRIARDLVEIVSAIATQKFRTETLIEMSQTQLPTDKMKREAMAALQQHGMQLQQQMQQAQAQTPPPAPGTPPDPLAPNPTADLQMQLQQFEIEMEKVKEAPTIEQVMHFLKDTRAKAFTLDIETDSTIMADEMGEKQRRTEFVGMLGSLLPQLSQMIQVDPQTATFCGELLKFATAPYRAGRSLDGAIDELVELAKAKGEQQKGDDPQTAMGKIQLQIEQMKQQTAAQKNQQDAALKQMEMQQKDKHKQWELQSDMQIKQAELGAKQRDEGVKMAVQNQKSAQSREEHQMHVLEKQQDMGLARQKFDQTVAQHNMKAADMSARAQERRANQQFKLSQPPKGV